MNSTYLEMVDGNYEGRGFLSFLGTLSFCMGAIGISTIIYFEFSKHSQSTDINYASFLSKILIISFPTTIFISMIIGPSLLNRSIGEWFRYTHYPIRFNRHNRMVYVFRGDGTVLEAPWDETYFTLHIVKKIAGITWYGISGLVLKDEKTVKEQFTFGFCSPDQAQCHSHWEFIRRYMEDGPRAVMHADGAALYIPIADKKETPRHAWTEVVAFTSGKSDFWFVVMLPFSIATYIGRLIANATCKVPLWPADVEAACRIDPDDPYVCDSRLNPPGYV
ncbi:DUF6708 domain-containing protein [Burkholderia stagnalis]|nr:DUF6708 domain-containing protein [Burkholderia stagnalis]